MPEDQIECQQIVSRRFGFRDSGFLRPWSFVIRISVFRHARDGVRFLRMVVEPPTYFNFARDVVERWARERLDACALWCVDDSGRNELKLSFRELGENLRRAAGLFNTAGIRRGDRVLIILPRVPQ